jgi:UDP-N-acetylglucosamine 4,6-dehydratase
MFKDKTLLITGGTGSFGFTVLKKFLSSDIGEIRVFSRDEKKQNDMRELFRNDKLKFYLGDVRDVSSIGAAMRGVDYVFHAAALKQVPSCEFYPMEAVKTNIIGTDNVIKAAVLNGVKRVVCLSTDKAVYPVNAMGTSKAMMEKVMVAASRGLDAKSTVICGTRYGNVLASRGSVVPLFVKQILANEPLTVTDLSMTRFMMTLDNAMDLVLTAFENGRNGDIFVQKSPAASIRVVVDTVFDIAGVRDHAVKIIGTRHGEKLYETLMSREEVACAEDLGEYFRIPPDLRDLNYNKYVNQGEPKISIGEDYNSHNATQLDIETMKDMFMKIDMMRDFVTQLNSR